MACASDLEALHAEYDAVKEETAALRAAVLGVGLAGDASGAAKLQVEDRPRSPTARVAILTREQAVLQAGLKLVEELAALRKSNEVLCRRRQVLHDENQLLRQENKEFARKAEKKSLAGPLSIANQSPVVGIARERTERQEQQHQLVASVLKSGLQLDVPSQPPMEHIQQQARSATPTLPKCTPVEKQERRELVREVLKAGVNQDIQTISALRSNVLPPPHMLEGELTHSPDRRRRSRSTDVKPLGGSAARLDSSNRNREPTPPAPPPRGRTPPAPAPEWRGSKMRESSHSGLVTESTLARELAFRDMLRDLGQNASLQ